MRSDLIKSANLHYRELFSMGLINRLNYFERVCILNPEYALKKFEKDGLFFIRLITGLRKFNIGTYDCFMCGGYNINFGYNSTNEDGTYFILMNFLIFFYGTKETHLSVAKNFMDIPEYESMEILQSENDFMGDLLLASYNFKIK